MKKLLLLCCIFMVTVLGFATEPILRADHFKVYNYNDSRICFYLYQDADEVVKILGKPDNITYETKFPLEKDEYNHVNMEYKSGLYFRYQKGECKIDFIEVTSPDYYVSKSRVRCNSSTFTTVCDVYGNMTDLTGQFRDDEFYVAYSTHEKNIIGENMTDEEYKRNDYVTFLIQFDFPYATQKLRRISLVFNRGV